MYDIENMMNEFQEYESELEQIRQMSFSDAFIGATTIEELDNYEPTEGTDTYDTGEAMEVWEFQGDTNRCAQYSQMFVIEEFCDAELDPDEFSAFSESQGWFSEEGGTTIDNMNKMLDYFGIENYPSSGNSFTDLIDCLENDGRAIVAVDSGEYWDGETDSYDTIDPSDGADHAIEVIGYDSETDCVIVNDSGNPNGCGEMIPRETFMDAWEDSGNYMVECYQ